MGAVFTAAARATLTSLASVVEMTGDFALTLPVMLAVAIASAVRPGARGRWSRRRIVAPENGRTDCLG